MQGQVSKAAFIRALGLVLQCADADIEKTVLYDEETVEITYSSGSTKQVNIACDSRRAIIIDVVKATM